MPNWIPAILTECMACFDEGTPCLVARETRGRPELVVQINDPVALLKVPSEKVRVVAEAA